MNADQIARWRVGDSLAPLLRLAATTYPGQELTSEDYLDWQYRRNPDGPVLLHLGQSDQGVAAQYLVVPHTYWISGAPVMGSLSVNTLTDPMHRGEGWFVRLAEATYSACQQEGLAFTIGFPNRQSHSGFVGRLEFRSLGNLEFLAMPLRWTGILRRLVSRTRKRKGSDLPIALPSPCLYRSKEYCIEDWEPGALSETFFRHFHESKLATTHRTSAYLMWRYQQCPTRHYRFLRITDPGRTRMLGFVVIRALELSGLRSGVLVDFGCLPDTMSALAELFRFAIGRFQASGLETVVAAAVPASEEADQLIAEGFYRVPVRFLPQPLNMILRTHIPQSSSGIPTDLRSWFLTFGDYDVL
ncbi:hypothetical protein [Candidatus Pollutiaquabacter sp.]|uniref:hypothetical protein n=1 Tax=Candidatus Pollutiaquabacter sp. TaxID=3416354 RepID=UPI003C7F26CD|nr:GNAT family N-acetyltransferase [Bacteroidota bacterium]